MSKILETIGNSLIIENAAQDISIFVANHDVYRPKINGSPFSKDLVFERGSLGWHQVMETHFYLYPVHVSHMFLMPPTVAASLYLVLLYFLGCNYRHVFKMIDDG